MIKQIQIRPATQSDLTKIISLLHDDKLGRDRESVSTDLSAYQSAFAKIQTDPNQELIVATLNDQIVGTFQLSYIQYLTYSGGLRAQIEAVRVDSDYRGHGIGRHMFEWAINRAKEKGAHLLQLTTDKKRPEALRFYTQLGFVSSHEGMKLHF